MDTSVQFELEQRLHSATDDSTVTSVVSYRHSRQQTAAAANNNAAQTLLSNISATTLRRLCTLLLLFTLFSSAYSCGPGRGIGGPRKNRKLTPLVFKQHVPNMSEKTLGASGLNEGAIKRDSPKFKDLVPNYNKDIIFKDEEGTGADRLMSRRCKDKLNTLAVSVMNQWPGVRLRVTESWDEDNLHGSDSLHYEGRAVDITTSDRDRTKYGMLARLAVEAGFDWVYYESRAHIHCSVKSDSAHPSHVSGCFAQDSSVLTASGARKQMRELQIGESVLSMRENGDTVYSEVILFMDRNLELQQEFVQLHTDSGAQLTVTPGHLVMVWNAATGVTEYTYADRIEIGTLLFVQDVQQRGGEMQPQRVSDVGAVRQKGVVAPLTTEGTIVVDSVAASCYALIDSQRLAHWSLAPMRALATLRSWMPAPGMSKRQHQLGAATEVEKNEKSNRKSPSTATQQNGIHWYPRMLYALKDYVVPKEWRYQ